jgi:hypothetical protein
MLYIWYLPSTSLYPFPFYSSLTTTELHECVKYFTSAPRFGPQEENRIITQILHWALHIVWDISDRHDVSVANTIATPILCWALCIFWMYMISMTFEKSCPCALTEHHAMKEYWQIGGIAPCILYSDTRWRWAISFTPRPLYPKERAPGTH